MHVCHVLRIMKYYNCRTANVMLGCFRSRVSCLHYNIHVRCPEKDILLSCHGQFVHEDDRSTKRKCLGALYCSEFSAIIYVEKGHFNTFPLQLILIDYFRITYVSYIFIFRTKNKLCTLVISILIFSLYFNF